MGPIPPNPYHVGDVLSAREMTEQQEDAWRGNQVVGAGSSGIVRPPGAQAPIMDGTPVPRVFARITGRGSGCAFSGASGYPYPPEITAAGPNCYCGIEQQSLSDGTIQDLDAGINWDSFSFPLVEMTGRDDVPVDAIVWTSPARTGSHWEFIWEGAVESPSGSGSGGGTSGSGCQSGISLCDLIRCINGQLQIACGCLYVTVAGKRVYIQYEFPNSG